jgi:predicted membrane protein
MEIDIIRKDFDYLLIIEKLLWGKYIKSIFNVLLIFGIAGGLFFLDAIDNYNKTGSFFGLTFSLAIGFLLNIFLMLFYLLLSKYLSLKKTEKLIATYKEEKESATIKITGWGIKSKGLDVSSEYSWSYFEGYNVLGNYLLLTPRYNRLQKLFFERDEMSTEQYNELVLFLNNKYLKRNSGT